MIHVICIYAIYTLYVLVPQSNVGHRPVVKEPHDLQHPYSQEHGSLSATLTWNLLLSALALMVIWSLQHVKVKLKIKLWEAHFSSIPNSLRKIDALFVTKFCNKEDMISMALNVVF